MEARSYQISAGKARRVMKGGGLTKVQPQSGQVAAPPPITGTLLSYHVIPDCVNRTIG